MGHPEPLAGNLQGEYSRRIDEKNRLVYHIEDGKSYIAHCRGHYTDK
ncbi:MAG: type II toxin-antitoxin system YoeB family toxin [Synergistaceae bacterium]|nr:type II toxin-antitoxin system YoeB family toxin [Synergistaceae bacterium]